MKEYPKSLLDIKRDYYINPTGGVINAPDVTVNQFKTEKSAKQVLALIQILSFRDAVWEMDDWKPDFLTGEPKYTIENLAGEIKPSTTWSTNKVLSFKSEETRDWFFSEHEELLKQAMNLL